MPAACRSCVTPESCQPSAVNCSADQSKSAVLSVLKCISPPVRSTSAYRRRNAGAVRRSFASRLFGHGSQKFMYILSASPGANISVSAAASPSMKRTFSSSLSRMRSIAIIIASGTFSIARNSVSGMDAAVSAVKRPLPQPSSTYSFS